MGSSISYALATEEEARKGAYEAKVESFTVKDAFIKNSSLDFTRTEEILGPSAGQAPSVLFVHGGGSCRKMFLSHAREFAKHGYRCVLLDLPGHGSRMDEELSLSSAISVIVDTVKREAPPGPNNEKPLYIGGSLGGYVGMEVLGAHPDMFSGAIITMCGQNVGVGAGLAARAGLSAMSFAVWCMGSAGLLKGMRSAAKQNGHISSEHMLEIALRPGMFFGQGKAMIDVLRASNPLAALPRFGGPILFINGSKDHRDSETKWLASAAHGRLIDYEGADHFFSHDERFEKRFIEDCLAFAEEALGKRGPNPASTTVTSV